MRIISLLAATTVISGCSILSNSYNVTYDSKPQSAMVVCNGDQRGFTPLTYKFPKEAARSGRLALESCKAVWQSGAQDAYPKSINTMQFPNGATAVAVRPKGHRGLSADLHHEQRNREFRRESFEQDQRVLNDYRNSLNSNRSYQRTPIQTNCTQIGKYTSCTSY